MWLISSRILNKYSKIEKLLLIVRWEITTQIPNLTSKSSVHEFPASRQNHAKFQNN